MIRQLREAKSSKNDAVSALGRCFNEVLKVGGLEGPRLP